MSKILFKISLWISFPAILFIIIIAGSGPGKSTEQSYTHINNNQVIDGEIIIMLKQQANITYVIANQEASFSKEPISAEHNIWKLKYDPGINDSPSGILNSLISDANVIVAQFNHQVTLRENAPDDPRFDEQWGLNNTGQVGGVSNADIKALKAWDITTGGLTKDGKEIVIAVIDDGFFLNHFDLTFWKNKNEIPGNKIDDDNNGFTDDYDGWNAANNNGTIIPLDHGTRVCGVIGAKGNNYNGIAGVNWKVGIMPVQIKADPEIDEASVLRAYAYVLKQRQLYNQTNGTVGSYVVAANSSFGLDFEKPEDHPIWCEFYNKMGKEGILNVAATMNNNSNVDITGDVPTACGSDFLITVTSTTRSDDLYIGSAYGPVSIDIGAPGLSILSTSGANMFSSAGGTSLAAPHVTGMIGLLYAAAHQSFISYGTHHPDSLALTFKNFILNNVDHLSSLSEKTVSEGRLNLFYTLKQVERPFGSDNYAPTKYMLSQNYPNPFNPSTTIVYDVFAPNNIKISVFNSVGQEVSTLIDSYHTRGRYTIHFNSSSLPSGVYYYRIDTKYFTDTKKMVLLK